MVHPSAPFDQDVQLKAGKVRYHDEMGCTHPLHQLHPLTAVLSSEELPQLLSTVIISITAHSISEIRYQSVIYLVLFRNLFSKLLH